MTEWTLCAEKSVYAYCPVAANPTPAVGRVTGISPGAAGGPGRCGLAGGVVLPRGDCAGRRGAPPGVERPHPAAPGGPPAVPPAGAATTRSPPRRSQPAQSPYEDRTPALAVTSSPRRS